jgi:hypothetical protein
VTDELEPERESTFLAVARRSWVPVSCLVALCPFLHLGSFAWVTPSFWTSVWYEPRTAAAVFVAALLLFALWPRWWTAAIAWCATALWIAYACMLAAAGC